jgi:hypothetical protein
MANDIVVNVAEFLHTDMHVFDSEQERLGTVRMFNVDAGYFMVEKGVFAHKDLYIPFQLIRTIDPNEIFLKQPKDALERDYLQPPAITTQQEEREGHVESTSTVKSGFDDRPVVVSRIDVSAMAQQLRSGMTVYDVEGTFVGSVTQFDSARAVMTVENGVFSPKVLFIPFSLIQQVYPSDSYLMLGLPKDALQKDLGRYTAIPAK